MNNLSKPIVIGTRGSKLALWQANFIKKKLDTIGLLSELKIIKTQGDKLSNTNFNKLEGKGFFTKELEEELLKETIDLAVHSHKDLPTQSSPGLKIAAVSDREDPSDLLLILKNQIDVTQKLSIALNKTIGTSSSRRKAQLLALRPDLNVKDLRGNIETRIQKLRNKQYHGIIIAKAGITRLNLNIGEFYVEELSPTLFIPAPAQGVLALQIRENDTELFQKLQPINNPEVAEQIAIEREVLHLFDGGCHTPLGCYCRKKGDLIQIWTTKATAWNTFPDRFFIEDKKTTNLTKNIISKFSKTRKQPKKIFITRHLPKNSYLRRSLENKNILIDARSLVKTYPTIHKLDSFILKKADWIFFNSKNAIDYFFQLKPELPKEIKLGVIGRGSEEILRSYGKVPDFTGEKAGINIIDVAQQFAAIVKNKTVLFPQAKDSLQTIQKALFANTKIIELPIYETIQEKNVAATTAEVLIFTSPSNVEAYFRKHLLQPEQKVICIGNSSGDKAREMGASYLLPHSPDEIGLTEAIFGLDI